MNFDELLVTAGFAFVFGWLLATKPAEPDHFALWTAELS